MTDKKEKLKSAGTEAWKLFVAVAVAFAAGYGQQMAANHQQKINGGRL